MADAPETRGGGTCPTCGSPVENGQLVCLTCGTRVGLHYSKPPRWQVPAILAALVVALAVVGVFIALQAATGAGEDEVAAGPASRQEARQREPEKRQPQAPAATTTTETTDTKPKARPKPQPKPKPKASPEPDPPEDAGLKAAKRGPTAVLSGVAEPGAAAKIAKRLKSRGFRIGAVTNAPGPAERSAVLYARGGRAAARALAKEADISTVKALDRATAGPAGGAKLVVVLGASS